MKVKEKFKCYPGQRVVLYSKEESLNAKDILLKYQQVFEILTKFIALISAAALLLGVVLGFFTSIIYYSEFGISYLDLADFDDYIRASLAKFYIVAPFLLLIYIVFFNDFFVIEKIPYLKTIMFTLIFIYVILIKVLDGDRGSSFVESSENWKSIALSKNGTVEGIKLGHDGIQKIEYGKDLTEKACLVFIGKIAEHTYFWSLSEQSLFSVNTASLITFSVQLSEKPSQMRWTKSKRFRGKESFLNSDFGKKAMAWEKKKELLCPNAHGLDRRH